MGLFDIFKKKAKEVSEPTSSYTSDVGVNSSKRSTKNASKEFEKYLTLAEQGDAKIQLNLALCYIFGHGTAVDNVKASKWILKAAEQGDAKACFFAGRVYFYGAGVPQDYQESLKWYRKAADKGVLRAQHDIATSYKLGEGVPQSYSEAAKWYRKAAENEEKAN